MYTCVYIYDMFQLLPGSHNFCNFYFKIAPILFFSYEGQEAGQPAGSSIHDSVRRSRNYQLVASNSYTSIGSNKIGWISLDFFCSFSIAVQASPAATTRLQRLVFGLRCRTGCQTGADRECKHNHSNGNLK